MTSLTALELCAGAGGQALGLEQAGFEHAAVAEIDPGACTTLRANRPGWKVIEDDIRSLDGTQFCGVDLVAGGVPCTPFSIGGQQLGESDDRHLFPEALRIVEQARPRAVMLENVPGLAQKRFASFRLQVVRSLNDLGYAVTWRIIQAADHGVPQLRPRYVLVALRDPWWRYFRWPEPSDRWPCTVGSALVTMMGENGWPWHREWAWRRATQIAPTIVGGSKKHGGPDLGPTRARAQWLELGVNGSSVAEEAPPPCFPYSGNPRLTVPMVARLQGFPAGWQITGRKTAAYRQVGNSFPPPVARALGTEICSALHLCYRNEAHP